MAGLFDTFTISKRGLNVQQGNINTGAHNIANASTPGYSRQRAVIETTRPFGGTSKFDGCIAGQVGTGAQITTIQRIRNEFVDFQYREANSILGNSSIKETYLSKVENIIGETSDTGLQGLISNFYKSLQTLTSASEKTDVKSVVLQNALSLSDSLNYTYNQLEKQLTNAQDELGIYTTEINGYLDQINELNKQISRMTSLGQSPNDLMDSRDLLLDQLSSKFGVNIDKKALNAIDVNSDEYENLKLVNANPNDFDYNRFSTVKSATIEGGKLKIEYYKLGDQNSEPAVVTLAGNENDLKALKKQLETCRVLITDKDGNFQVDKQLINADGNYVNSDGALVDADGKLINANGQFINKNGDLVDADGNPSATAVTTTAATSFTVTNTNLNSVKKSIFQAYQHETGVNNVPTSNDKIKGEIAGNQSVQETIKSYMNQLDKIAASIAYTINAIQTGSDGKTTNPSSTDLIFVVNNSNPLTDDGISAKNITVNKALLNDPTKLNCKAANESGNGANERAMAMATLNTLKLDFGNIPDDSTGWNRHDFLAAAGVSFKNGDMADGSKNIDLSGSANGSTMVNYYASMISKIGSATKAASMTTTNQESVLQSLYNQRQQESGVSLDEEMTDLITFQHAYQANAKMISTIDELLDVVINGLKR
ncbi:flagellar hook-associated protein FlgK [uncultured Clostridium sp.]|uniref:flagellar hook-associated protein FlgK n=1 Tax=uncultured Clostridium sp. TaxID=59620 RepID=UPI0025F1E2F0|nr:flagellar hook-associated protein FlgK [uncultured Clostridium sp.]